MRKSDISTYGMSYNVNARHAYTFFKVYFVQKMLSYEFYRQTWYFQPSNVYPGSFQRLNTNLLFKFRYFQTQNIPQNH